MNEIDEGRDRIFFCRIENLNSSLKRIKRTFGDLCQIARTDPHACPELNDVFSRSKAAEVLIDLGKFC